jgi:GTP-dependent phosphoenolpyruvate carboxykinase
MDGSDLGQTEWNGGALTNIRINDILNELRMNINQKNLLGIVSNLTDFNVELYGFQKHEQKVKLRMRLDKLTEEVHAYINLQSKLKRKGIPSEILFEINNIRYELYEIFNNSQLQTSLRESADDAF